MVKAPLFTPFRLPSYSPATLVYKNFAGLRFVVYRKAIGFSDTLITMQKTFRPWPRTLHSEFSLSSETSTVWDSLSFLKHIVSVHLGIEKFRGGGL